MKKRAPLLILLIAIIVQATLVPYMSVGWFRPDLPILVIAWMAVRWSSLRGIAAGFIAGLIVDALSSGFFGLSSLSYCTAALILGRFFYSDIPLSIGRWLFATAVGILIYALVFCYFFSLNTAPAFQAMILTHALPTALYTWCIGVIWALSPLYEKR